MISDIALTADNPLHCVLGEGTGQWTGPANISVQCGDFRSGPFSCSNSSDSSSIALYKNSDTSYSGKQLFTCTGGGSSVSIQIESEYHLCLVFVTLLFIFANC